VRSKALKLLSKDIFSCIENIYKIDENIGHEITQIYFVDFKDRNFYQKVHVTEGNKITRAKWFSKEEIFSSEKVLYPN
jgi:hypothetical protein